MIACAISGCGDRHYAKGWCRRHYRKWQRYGSADHKVNAEHGEPLAWLQDHVSFEGADCLPWPFRSHYSKGYGAIWFEGQLAGAHRVMCRLAHGEPPELHMHAAHFCGRRDCVNPKHLRWATASENERDKVAHGTQFIPTRD